MTAHIARGPPALITLTLLVNVCHEYKCGSTTVLACLPRVSRAAGKPFFWSLLFGQRDNDSGNNEPANNVDKETEQQAQWTTNDWIVRNNFELEVHNVTTSDGYQLQLQRMPLPGHRPVLLVHGIFSSSLGWVFLGPERSLAFLLRNKQYDVWLANLRGSAFGRNHTHFNASAPELWSYSFHEHGIYDLPAIIDHIRDSTSFHQVLLIGHSQALNAFLALLAELPIYNERILFMQALAPIAALWDNVKFESDDVRKLRKFIKNKESESSFEMFPIGYLKQKCLKSGSDDRKECKTWMKTYAGTGHHTKQMEYFLYASLLSGGSLKEVLHLTQIWKSGDFVSYDYDVEGNRQFYNTVEPHSYDLQQVTVPLVLHYGASDAIATPSGVHRIYSRLLKNVIGVYRVNADKFNHFDFICGNNVKSLVNDKIIDIMEKYLSGKLLYVIE